MIDISTRSGNNFILPAILVQRIQQNLGNNLHLHSFHAFELSKEPNWEQLFLSSLFNLVSARFHFVIHPLPLENCQMGVFLDDKWNRNRRCYATREQEDEGQMKTGPLPTESPKRSPMRPLAGRVQFAAACVHANVCRGLHRVPDSRCRLRIFDTAESRPRRRNGKGGRARSPWS